jgi:hypothetical protein
MEHEPWLQAKSEVPQFLGVFLGAVGVILLMMVLASLDLIPKAPHPLGALCLLLAAFAGMVALICLIWLAVALVCGRTPSHQYCPDCLSYMTRGAKVCPFCGFRPAVTQKIIPPPSVSSSGRRR